MSSTVDDLLLDDLFKKFSDSLFNDVNELLSINRYFANKNVISKKGEPLYSLFLIWMKTSFYKDYVSDFFIYLITADCKIKCNKLKKIEP